MATVLIANARTGRCFRGNRPKIIDFYTPWSPTVTQEVTLKAAVVVGTTAAVEATATRLPRGAKPGETL